jgi:hypothetical protein
MMEVAGRNADALSAAAERRSIQILDSKHRAPQRDTGLSAMVSGFGIISSKPYLSMIAAFLVHPLLCLRSSSFAAILPNSHVLWRLKKWAVATCALAMLRCKLLGTIGDSAAIPSLAARVGHELQRKLSLLLPAAAGGCHWSSFVRRSHSFLCHHQWNVCGLDSHCAGAVLGTLPTTLLALSFWYRFGACIASMPE